MYMRPGTSEQATHNNIIVCQALTILNLNFDIQVEHDKIKKRFTGE